MNDGREPVGDVFHRDSTCPRCDGRQVERVLGTSSTVRCRWCDGRGSVTLDDAAVYLDVRERLEREDVERALASANRLRLLDRNQRAPGSARAEVS